ncbi:MAG: VWA domain-containing protein [Spirochaetales bacterium]|nr:VWA domain-containing protein [Spirochaetales bacterium]MDY2924495.1 VWA domain-containing protein [Treponema sp.]
MQRKYPNRPAHTIPIFSSDTEDIFKAILDKFQTERNRLTEESFARTFAECDDARLFFINEDKAYTDGTNIIVDPAFQDIYKDAECLEQTEKVLSWPRLISATPWNALKMVSRSLTLHECLHLLYTNFPGNQFKDPDFFDTEAGTHKNELKTISNIIEDAYIEAVGASVYDNIGFYLMFNRIAPAFSKKETESTAESKFKIEKPSELEGFEPPKDVQNQTELTDEQKKLLEAFEHFLEKKKKVQTLIDYLDYMAGFLLYPMFDHKEPSLEIAEYVEKTKQFFLDGSIQDNPDDRYRYSKKIFKIIKPLIPKDDEAELAQSLLLENVAGQGTHVGAKNSIGGKERKGKSQAVTTRLFANLDGTKKTEPDTGVAELMIAVKSFEQDEKTADELTGYQGYKVEHSGNSVGASAVHKNIKINENHPKINLNFKKAYQNIYNHYHLNINSYNSRFLQLLRAQVPVRENKYLFGTGIDSKMMGDMKRRIWFRNTSGNEVPDMSVLLLIDGSGSMYGDRRNSAMTASVILHEVLKKQGIEHAIVEHRGHFEEPEIDVNILVDFNAKEEEKLNIMQLSSNGDNRDGLALYWAEKYMNKKTFCDNKLIIVLSDGQPAHDYDNYYGAVANKDTANAAKKIISRGTSVIAVALDDECGDDDNYSTYNDLKEIYPHLVQCKDLKRLTGQILNIVSRQLI